MKKIVIIGGGISGISLINELEKSKEKFNLILIEPKQYFEVPFGLLRSLVDPDGFSLRLRKKISQVVKCKHIIAKAAELKKNSVILDNGDEVDFDFCVIATGAAIHGFEELKIRTSQSIEDRDKQWKEKSDILRKAKDIAIIGGGTVGVELAGEIGEFYKDKNVVLYHKGDRLLKNLKNGASQKALRVLNDYGVKVELNSMAFIEKREKTKIVVNSSNKKFKYDIVYQTFGNYFETEFLVTNFNDCINKNNQIVVNEYLQLTQEEHLWAIGDINNVDEMKLGTLAIRQAKKTAVNLIRNVNNKKMKKYKPMRGSLSLVTLGRSNGIGQLPFGRFDLLAKYKQKNNLFVEKTLEI